LCRLGAFNKLVLQLRTVKNLVVILHFLKKIFEKSKSNTTFFKKITFFLEKIVDFFALKWLLYVTPTTKIYQYIYINPNN